MQTTGNLGLKKPEGTDIVDIADLNGNMDILDNAVTGKVDKVTGKQLSTNDYTTAEKTKLSGIATGANNYVHPNHTGDVISTGDGITAIAPGVIVDADVNAAAGIAWSKISKGGASLADLPTRSAGDLNSGTLPAARLPAATGDVTSPAGSNAFTLSAGVQSQINSKANLVTTPQQTTADITYYVRTDGNDNNTGLANTAVGAFKTIQKAIDILPRVVNHTVIIYVGAGAYTGSIYIQGFSGGGNINISGASSATTTHTVTGKIASIRNSCRILIVGLNSTYSTEMSFQVLNSSETFFQHCNTTVVSSYPAFYNESGKVYIANCVISNRSDVAIYAHVNGEVFAQDCRGSANGMAYRGSYGGRIHISGTTISGAVSFGSAEGGLITQGEGVINPWGDNKTTSRSMFLAGPTSIPLRTDTWTKLLYGTEYVDNLGEYDPTLSRFIPKQSGIYLISAAVSLPSVNSMTQARLRLAKNGVLDQLIVGKSMGFVSDCLLTGAMITDMTAGQILELYLWHNHGATINSSEDGTYCYFRVSRIA